MDALSAAAASAQLIGYCYSASRALFAVIKDIKEGPSMYSAQKANLQLLLWIVGQLSNHTIESDEGRDIVISLIIDISELASRARNLMNERSPLLKSIWNSQAKRSAIVAIFDALSTKRELLQLIVTHNNSSLLSRINQRLITDNSTEPLQSNGFESVINADNAKITNYSTMEIGTISEDLGTVDVRTLGGKFRRCINVVGATVDRSWMGIGKKRVGKNGGDVSSQEKAAHTPSAYERSGGEAGVLVKRSNKNSAPKAPASLAADDPSSSRNKHQTYYQWQLEGYESS
ncbi:hypothetical protein K449DRAFT_403297 [Hypoxylon sp. EC38]|nr:hypothetical protein K449DRAFT_403297 [Hypoxylon sp. EC38]